MEEDILHIYTWGCSLGKSKMKNSCSETPAATRGIQGQVREGPGSSCSAPSSLHECPQRLYKEFYTATRDCRVQSPNR